MKEEDFLFDNNNSQNISSFDLKRFLSSILNSWYWFILSILLFLLGAWLYTRYLTEYYETSTKVVIKDASNSPSSSDMLLQGITMKPQSGGIDNEMQTLKSSKIMEDVVSKLNLEVHYYVEGKVIDVEEYGEQVPYVIQVLNNPSNTEYTFRINIKKPNAQIILDDGTTKNIKIGHTFTIKNSVFKVISNPDLLSDQLPGEYNFKIKVINPTKVINTLKNLIKVNLTNQNTTALTISMEYPNTHKSEAILNQLIKSYNIDAINDKNIEFKKTEDFIDERIAILNNELGSVENTKQSFQSGNDIANLEAEVGMSISNKANLENQLLQTDAQLSLVNSYKDFVKDQSVNDILPSSIIAGANGGTSSAVSSYNQMVAARKNLLTSGATEEHPEVQNLTNSILDAKKSILANIQQQEKSLQKTRQGFASQLGSAASLKSKAPRLQKEARDIERQQGVKESLYLLLLQKREEAAISSAITQEKAKVLDPPTSTGPVRPKKSIYFLGAFALGLFIPLAVIYLKNAFRYKIETRQDLESIIKGIPILGELPTINSKEHEIQVNNSVNEVSEAFRVIRSNAEFLLSKTDSQYRGKVILITSSIKGEGKTFVSMNYAHVLSQIEGKKVIIIGADIRNPQLHRYTTKDKNTEGLTEFLYKNDNSELPVINTSMHDRKTDIIFSGQIPPNPTELLMSEKIPAMIDKLTTLYDYVIIDSAPILMVSDTFNLTSYVDLTIFVTRSNHTPKEVINYPIELSDKNRIKNLSFVLNDVSKSKSGYGYGYGYGYNYGYGYGYHAEKKKDSFWSKINPFKK